MLLRHKIYGCRPGSMGVVVEGASVNSNPATCGLSIEEGRADSGLRYLPPFDAKHKLTPAVDFIIRSKLPPGFGLPYCGE